MAKESIKTIGFSKVNIEVDFIELSKTKEYEKYKHLQNVNVADRIIVRYKDFDIDIKLPIQLDGEDITFTPKQKLLKGDNVLGIPIGIPQVKCGAHYLGIFLYVDAGSIKMPKFNLQCMIDGRNLQGGLNAESPHAEIKEYQPLVNINGLYFEKSQAGNQIITFKAPIPVIFGEDMILNNNLFRDKEITTNYNISFK